MEDVPGKPFGWAYHMERDEIRKHVHRKNDGTLRGAHRFMRSHRGMGVEFRVTAIQDRIHKYRPTLRERQLKLGVKQPRPTPRFTQEELALIAERFEGANDPIGQSIHAKASSYEP